MALVPLPNFTPSTKDDSASLTSRAAEIDIIVH